MHKINEDDTIVAISTPIGEGGIGIVRMSGAGALKIADEIFRAKDGVLPSQAQPYTVHYGHVVDGGVIDEVLLTVMRAPKSYTKEDVVEVNCHGGIQAASRVLALISKRGARLAEPGEFTKRAFLNGRIDLAQAEAVLDVIRAKTESSLKVAVGQLEGELSRSVNAIRDALIDMAAEIEASIDFPDEGLEPAKHSEILKRLDDSIANTERLIKSYDSGMIFREGVLAIICGKPNAGKSSLMNLLLKRDRVIVSPIPGTTRDAVEEMINLGGVPMRLVDTAGISATEDALEREGIKKSKSYLERADIAILMLDASTGIEKADEEIIRMIGSKKRITVINKIDIAGKDALRKLKERFNDGIVVEVSVSRNKNIDILEDVIRKSVISGEINQGEGAVVSNARHKEALDKAGASMLSVKTAMKDGVPLEILAIDLKDAIFNLGLIAGKSVSDDILDRIFSRFCIGK